MKIIGKSLVTALAVAVTIALAPTSVSAGIYVPYHPPVFKHKFYKHPKFYKHKVPKGGSSSTHHDTGPGGRDGLTPLQGYVTAGMFCSAIWLIVHAAYVSRTENRELTRREAYIDVAGCWLPIIGPLLVNQYLPRQYY